MLRRCRCMCRYPEPDEFSGKSDYIALRNNIRLFKIIWKGILSICILIKRPETILNLMS